VILLSAVNNIKNYSHEKTNFLTFCAIHIFFLLRKNTLDPSGQFNVKAVNASATAGPQSFALAGSVLIRKGLNFTDASSYINTASGKRLVTEFKNEGTNSVYASGEIWTANGVNFTFYLAGKARQHAKKIFRTIWDYQTMGKLK
jgi:hypothetical protein